MEWVAPSSQSQHLLALARHKTQASVDASILAALAATFARAIDCETVVVRLRDGSHHWTSVQHGSTGLGCLLEQSIALAAADHAGPLIAADAASHPLLRDHPLVASDAKVHSFAGIAAFAEAGDSELEEAVGVICALSDKRRDFGPQVTPLLESMAELMASLYAQQIALHRHSRTSAALEQDLEGTRRLQRQFRQAERMAAIGSWRMSIDGGEINWSDGVYAIHELPVGQDISIDEAVKFYAPAYRAQVLASIERAVQTGESYDFEADFVGATGTVKRVRVSGEVELADGRPLALVGVIQDMSEKHKLLQELERRADTDALTGLPNRSRFDQALASAVSSTLETGSPLGIVLVNLERVDKIGVYEGHAAGDELLRRASAILRRNWLSDTFVARLGEDEMVLLLQDQRHLADLSAVLDRLARELAAPLDFQGKSVAAGASLGASILHPGGACSGIDLLESAERALQAARRSSEAPFQIARPTGCMDCAADCLGIKSRGDRRDWAA